jgi:hypothetical protein
MSRSRWPYWTQVITLYIVHARLVGPIRGGEIPGLRQLIRDVTEPEDGVEHVHVAPNDQGVDVTMFVLKPTIAEAEAAAAQVCRRVARAGPWVVISCMATVAGSAADVFLIDEAPGKPPPGPSSESGS